MKKFNQATILFSLLLSGSAWAQPQVLSLKEAITQGLANYGTIRAKSHYVQASDAAVRQAGMDYLPNLTVSAQQDYGTVNGQNGPLYGFGGFGVASSGLPLPQQNWNAAFGALYLANLNWEFFTFGRIQARIGLAKQVRERDSSDLLQEQFQHQVRIAGAYLNLLAAQRLERSQQQNLARAVTFRETTLARTQSGLNAGVDSSLANAEVSNARIALINAHDWEQEQANKLAVLMGVPATDFVLDTTFISRIPKQAVAPSGTGQEHPLLKFYQDRLDLSNQQTKLLRKQYYPSLALVGIIQTRGSGFSSNYAVDQTAFTHSYSEGITPVRSNYLIGIGVNWNLTSIVRNTQQVKSQQFVAAAIQDEYDLVNQQLAAQRVLADTKMRNALLNYEEIPTQIEAASNAYVQKSALYRNGLTTLVDVTQTLYTLNRAETTRDIVYSNVWQALLLKAAASGDIHIFMNEF